MGDEAMGPAFGGRLPQEIGPTEYREIGAMWADIVRLQVSRLEDSVAQFAEALSHERLRAVYERNGRPDGWERVVAEADKRLTHRVASTVAADKYLLLHAIAQLYKCLWKLGANQPTLGAWDGRFWRELRNMEDHWEDPEGGAHLYLRERVPDIGPGRIGWNNGGESIWVEETALTDVLEWVDVAENALQRRRDCDVTDVAGQGGCAG